MTGKDRDFSWMGWGLLCAGLLFSSIAVLRFIPAMQAVLHEPEILGLDEDLIDVQHDRASWLSESNGGRWGRYGRYLASNDHGSLRIRLPFEQEGVLKLRLWFYSPGTLAVKIVDSAQVHDVPLAHLDGTIISMPMHGPTEIVVNASSDLSEEQLVVDRFVAAWSEPNDELPSLLPLLFGISLSGGMVYRRNWVAQEELASMDRRPRHCRGYPHRDQRAVEPS